MKGLAAGKKIVPIWQAQPGPQSDVLSCPADLILLGGARGGGKTASSMFGDWPQHMQLLGRNARGLVVRRKLKHAQELVDEAGRVYERIGGKWISDDDAFRFPNGARLRFAYLERDSDAAQFSGHNYTWVLVEEVNQIASWSAVDRILGTVRGGHKSERRFLMTCNPEGPGMGWLKSRFIDSAPEGKRILWMKFNEPGFGESRLSMVFIPAKVTDNKALLEKDTGYIAKLMMATEGNPSLRRAWLHGDWDALEGQFFSNFADWKDAGGVIPPMNIPYHWTRFLSADWGSNVPSCVHWWAIAAESVRTHRGQVIPKGALVLYREYYTVLRDRSGNPLPNRGTKLPAQHLGREIYRRSVGDPPRSYAVIDPSAFRQDGGPSVAEGISDGERLEASVRNMKMPGGWGKADNSRTPETGSIGGWDECRRRMAGKPVRGYMTPMVFVTEDCRDLIRTMPTMVHDPERPEDMKKKGAEDHAVDCFRYGIMSRPWIRDREEDSIEETGWTWNNVKKYLRIA